MPKSNHERTITPNGDRSIIIPKADRNPSDRGITHHISAAQGQPRVTTQLRRTNSSAVPDLQKDPRPSSGVMLHPLENPLSPSVRPTDYHRQIIPRRDQNFRTRGTNRSRSNDLPEETSVEPKNQPNTAGSEVIRRDVVRYSEGPEALIKILEANDLPYELQKEDEFLLEETALRRLHQMQINLQILGSNFTPAPQAHETKSSEKSADRSFWTDENDLNVPIPDNTGGGSEGVASFLDCPDSGTIWNVEYSILVNHAWPGDLDIFIDHFSTEELIWEHNYSLGSDGGLDDDVETDNDIFYSSRSTAVFNGMEASGWWGLRCVDWYFGLVGEIDWWSITVYYGCVTAPYPDDDTCYQTVIADDPFCCNISWDDVCDAEYWACYAPTCVEAPYPNDDACYESTVLTDSNCCSTDWDALCQCEYSDCAGISDQDPPYIASAVPSDIIDVDGNGFYESWGILVDINANCGGLAPGLFIEISTPYIANDLTVGNGPFSFGNEGMDTINMIGYPYWTNIFYDLDTPQVVTFRIFVYNDYGSSELFIDIPIDEGCGAVAPDYPLSHIYCYFDIINSDSYCCDTEWDAQCQCELDTCTGDAPPLVVTSITPSGIVDENSNGYYENWNFEVNIDTNCLPVDNVYINVGDNVHGDWGVFGPFSFSGNTDADNVILSFWQSSDYGFVLPQDVNFNFAVSHSFYYHYVDLTVPVDSFCADSPYADDDACYLDVISSDNYCCEGIWDSVCENEYWNCLAPTCVEAPYLADDSCYYNTVMDDAFCCSTEWDTACQCAYNACAGITDQDAPVIVDAGILDYTDMDDNGWYEQWSLSVNLAAGCGVLAPSVRIEISAPDLDLGYSILDGFYDVGPTGLLASIVLPYDFSSQAYGLDTPQIVTVELTAYNDFGSSVFHVNVPVDIGCSVDPPTPPPFGILCNIQTLVDDTFCCDETWDQICEEEFWDCWLIQNVCVEMPYPADDGCFQQAMSEDPLGCCADWSSSCQAAYDGCVASLCNDIPGDINQDGFVNVSDIVYLVGIILESLPPASPCELSVADLMVDGTLNVIDIVALVDLILNPRLTDRASISKARLFQENNSLTILSDGQIAGLQLETQGDYIIAETYLPEGWQLQRSDRILLIFSADGSPLETDTLFSYDGTLTISAGIVADWNGNGVSAGINTLINGYTLLGTYPNPFNPSTDISYSIPQNCQVSITVFDMLGKLVEQLVDERQSAGLHRVRWDATDQPSGIYFIKMETPGNSETQQILLLK
ncbi:MAG: T9SS type A sorting domain-containing protein [FCB group bacterium]|nr:T9SS type A sorting domain-containing protein [FCB group bacterium]